MAATGAGSEGGGIDGGGIDGGGIDAIGGQADGLLHGFSALILRNISLPPATPAGLLLLGYIWMKPSSKRMIHDAIAALTLGN